MKTKVAPTAAAPALPNNIAANIRLLRKRKGWSQAELGRRVHLNRGNIASYESGSAEPSICKLLRISNLLEVHPHDITRRDLSNPRELELARVAHDERRLEKRERLAAIRKRTLELTELVSSSKKLFEYKRKRLENPCKEADLFAAQYEQLFEVTQQLLEEHRTLLTEAGCGCE